MPKSPRARQEAKTWKAFSEYIRLRDANNFGECVCITCGVRKHYKEMDAGHYMSRSFGALKYDERNVHTQCKRCNGYKCGEQALHGEYIAKKYGRDLQEYFVNIYKQKAPFKRTMKELREIEEWAKNKVKSEFASKKYSFSVRRLTRSKYTMN